MAWLLLAIVLPGHAFAAVQAPTTDLPRAEEIRVQRAEGALVDRVQVIYWPGGDERATRIIRLLGLRPELPWLPPTVPSRAVFYLAPDLEVWNFLTGGQVPDWGAGVAIPDRQIAVIPLFEAAPGGPRDRDRTALHEWAHLGLHEYLRGLRIPRWFDEGYAQRVSGGWNVEESWRLRVGLSGGGAPPLDSISLDWPRGRSDAELAYLLAGSAIEYLATVSGDRGLEVFLLQWRELRDFEEAFRRTFGYTTGTFETRWIEHVRRRYGWVLLLTQTAIFWAFAGLALVALVRLRSQRDLERLARLRATQPPSRPAYWEGPPTPPIGGFRSDARRRPPG